ncbi:MAG TPA: potassium channel protein [Propionibacteriaceae bacterium]|nr:potassium channel protein [Propionibacteriaceae bacterium]
MRGPRGVARARRLQSVRPVSMILTWIVVVAGISAIGAAGYMALEGWNLLDALYMAVITLTTTGFREVHTLSPAGQVWTMILSVVAIGIIFGTVGIVAEQTVGDAWTGRRGQRLMQRLVDSLSGHYIICGYGRVGSLVARDLTAAGHEVVVLDIGEDSLARAEADGYPIVHGDGTSDAVLLRAGIHKARGLVSCIDSDASNVYVTLSARTLNPKLFIVGRAGDEGVVQKLRIAGADRAISPYTMAGTTIANMALRPRVLEFIDAALSRGDLAFTLEEVTVDDALAGQTIADLRARKVFTLAISRTDGSYEPNPSDSRVLSLDEHLIVSGSSEAVAALG